MAKPDKARFGKLALHDEERLTAGLAHHREPAWSRDGKLIAFSVGDERDASFIVTDRRGRVARSLEGPASGTAAFSPDGAIAFTRRFGASREIWLTPGGDAPAVRLLGGDGRLYFDPAFSPDGATLACAVVDEPQGNSHLLLVELATGHRLALPCAAERADRRPSFSPQGDELVFEGRSDGDRAVYALHLIRNELIRLTPTDECARRPAVIDPLLIVYERIPHAHDGAGPPPAALALLDRKRGRSHLIVEDAVHRTQPACFVDDKGKVRLAYVAQVLPKAGAAHPPRFELYTARLRGVSAARDEADETAAAS